MQITIEYLKEKRQEYERGYTEHLALANAHHGAMEAIDELIARINRPEETTGQDALTVLPSVEAKE